MIKPLTLSQRLLERADASDEDCRTDDGDIMREADEALKAKDAEVAKLLQALQNIISSDDTGPMIYESRENGPSQAIGGSEGKFAAIARAALKENAQ